MSLEINEQFRRTLDILENSAKNVFITGKAGTGKSTLLDYFRNHTKKKVAVLAPTGVAAVNIKGQTIHSFFRFKPNITPEKAGRKSPKKIYQKLDAIIIDEISMVRADLLDCVDKFLRVNGKKANAPFGGVQMIFIGDLYQLPPVVVGNERMIFKKEYDSEYFFSAKVFSRQDFSLEFIELEKIYRQKDEKFISLLNAIRNNSIDDNGLELINERYFPDFERKQNDFFIHLTPTNRVSREINERELEKLSTQIFHYQGEIEGKFDEKYLPTEKLFSVKAGAQIMFLNNDREKRWVNGTIGKIISIEGEEEESLIKVRLNSGMTVEVFPYTWELFEFYFDENKGRLGSRTIGSFTQYPLKLAWSVTIHKSQGKTFDNVIIDIDRGTFAHGQMYVALSRCTTLEGIILKKKISKKHIWMDWRVVKFLTGFQYEISQINLPLEKKIEIIKDSIRNKKQLEITYLKSDDTKSIRVILPKKFGQMEYMEKEFIGVIARCLARNDDRVFRIDRILEMKVL
ncbi:MAG: AAA ATPase [Candidatus Moranbacteria bacterium GW2011_GWF2_36_839]|nr:MAG: AAA ATPase [Candidatus Moranbacteria bacterium GW2011_GWF1_36_78]KKQ16923.1 MAG: AAA ATPase [Candidatus Moranbacteria bacterium GW2011_GWF2_36_839]HAT73643.1 AAA family ATPase [Candidatus Moranbacteria bacterium]HBY10488.1 AAA family ATPase [Candidatus Moranbacteria bacterium]